MCFRDWYQVPIALHKINLPWPLSELNLPMNFPGLYPQNHHLLVIVLPSDRLPFVYCPPLGNSTISWSLPIVHFGKTESEEQQNRRRGMRETTHCVRIQGQDVMWEGLESAQNLGQEHVAKPEPYCVPGSLMAPQIILMPFV